MVTRRAYLELLAVGAATTIAGCSENETEYNPDPADTVEPDRDPATEPTPTEKATPTVDIVSSEVFTAGGVKWVRADIENPTEFDHGELHLNHSIYDEEGTVVDSRDGLIDLVPAGETWRYYSHVLGERRDAAASVESSIITDVPQRPEPAIDDVTIVSSTLNKDYRSMTEIVGEIRNEGQERSFDLVGLIYTDGGILRGSVETNIHDLDPGETRAFRAGIVGQWTPRTRDNDLPTRHEMYALGY